MKNLGYIKLYRKIRDNSFYKEKRRFSKLEAWIDLLLKANHKEAKILVDLKVVKISKGQVFTSQLGLSQEWRWAIGSVNTFLKFLKAETQIDYKGENKYTLISILNWDKYQGNSGETETRKEVKTETRLKPERNQTETIKKNKNNKKEIDTSPFSLINFFIALIGRRHSFSYVPSQKDRRMLDLALDKFKPEQVKGIFEWYLTTKKSQEHLTISSALSTHSLNLWEQEKAKKKWQEV